MIELTLREPLVVPLDVSGITACKLRELSLAEIARLPVRYGRHAGQLGDFFHITGSASEQVRIVGDLSKLRNLAAHMTAGKLFVDGDVGLHTGANMRGGEIEIRGDAGDWLGAEMSGGRIAVYGNAGSQIGAAYRGGARGMTNGIIRISGNAGVEVGLRMRRGLIVIGGNVGDFAGLRMLGGTLVLAQGSEHRTGVWMRRGTIVSLGPLRVTGGFAAAGRTNPTWLNFYGRQYAREFEPLGIQLAPDETAGAYARYAGDFDPGGTEAARHPARRNATGEILVWHPA